MANKHKPNETLLIGEMVSYNAMFTDTVRPNATQRIRHINSEGLNG
jgi:hypothetical protein